MNIPRMRTISEAISELRAEDPQTAITTHFLRQAIASGRLPAIKAGRKILINLETLSEFLSRPEAEEPQTRGVRRIG
jgi:excisionase family DNA binding protein